MNSTTVDSVIVAYRSEGVIERTVSLASALGGRVVVVDHGDGEAAHRAAMAGAVALLDRANPGFGSGQNRGMTMTTSEYVLLCNPDAQICSGAIRAGARLMESRPDVAAMQGVIVNRAMAKPERSAGVELRPIHLLGRALGARRLLDLSPVRSLARQSTTLRDHVDRVPECPVEVDSLAATAVLVRRSAFHQVSGFDPSYFLYGEDLDLCRRLRQAGWKLLTGPDVWATHEGGGSADSSWSREVTWWRGTMQFAARWWGPVAWWAAMAAATIRWARLAFSHPHRVRAAYKALVRDPVAERARHRDAKSQRYLRSIAAGD